MLLINKEYERAIIQHIDNTKNDIRFTLFHDSFHSKVNGNVFDRYLLAVIKAQKRGVSIKILCNNEKQVEKLRRYNIQVRKAKGFKTMHAKVFVFDQETMILGSHNLTDNAVTTNLEISVILTDKEIVNRFLKYFDIVWQS